jgi:leucyl-tRNA synthetase
MSRTHYDFKSIEKKWQDYWESHKTFKVEIDPHKEKFYCLDMFPYPSGQGLHIGHPEGYTATDILCRYKRMKGFNVLHPMGWDAFGLPAENYALKTGTHPAITTAENIRQFRRQIKRLGFSYDWDREVNTTDPSYYQWTQWIFIQLYRKGLAYEAETPINWCASCKTGLANEEVKEGCCERCSERVSRKKLRQWMLKITEYADRLLEDLEALDWPEAIKEQQRNWIGRSEGAEITFTLDHPDHDPLLVFTSRPDTLFGATFMVLAPEHPLLPKILQGKKEADRVQAYIQEVAHKSDLDRTELTKNKTGLFTGAYAFNPANQQKIPIWVADYVLMSYGTGAIMSVPAHDTRDYEFAQKFHIPLIEVISGGDLQKEAYTGEGILVNSGFLNGLSSSDAKTKMIEFLEEKQLGKRKIHYKLRDWVFSRQRYWGEPFPLVHTSKGPKLLEESELPLLLPEVEKYQPSETGESPLARATHWITFTDPETGETLKRESNTMPQWAGSCWYYLRFIDPQNKKSAWSSTAEKYWMPVDLYVGGAEHAVLHLLYARFWHKVLYDLGYVHTKEPFQKLVNQGLILGYTFRCFTPLKQDQPVFRFQDIFHEIDEKGKTRHYSKTDRLELEERVFPYQDVVFEKDSPRHPQFPHIELDQLMEKMSKSRGNVVNPDHVIDDYGSDSLRLFEMFLGPLEVVKPWSMKGVEGVHKFLHRVWRLYVNAEGQSTLTEETPQLEHLKALHKTIQQVSYDTENLRFNTAISRMMEFVNLMTPAKERPRTLLEPFILLLAPYAPHLCEEIWESLGHASTLSYETWPVAEEQYLVKNVVAIVIQINGKFKGTQELPCDLAPSELEAEIKKLEKVQQALQGKTLRKVVIVPNKVINFVIS